jgi:hypothetical protein
MTGVATTGPANAWAVGFLLEGPQQQIVNQLFVVHWNGKTWRTVTIPGGDGFFATSVEASSASDVWIFGQNDFAPFNQAVFRYDGAHWHEMAAPSYVTPAGGSFSVGGEPLVLGASDVWMPTDFSSCTYSGKTAPKCSSIVWHWDGHAWKSHTFGASIDSLAGVAPDDVMAVGVAWTKSQLEAGTTVAYRWNGARWVKVAVPKTPVYASQASGWSLAATSGSVPGSMVAAQASRCTGTTVAGPRLPRSETRATTWSPTGAAACGSATSGTGPAGDGSTLAWPCL